MADILVDESLHAGVVAGDATARETLLGMVWPRLVRQLRRTAGVSRDTAVDAAVDALMEYFRAPAAFDPSRGVPLDRFLSMAARRNLSNYFKSECRRKVREHLYAQQWPTSVNDGGSGVIADDLRRSVLAASASVGERTALAHWLDDDTPGLIAAIEKLEPGSDTPERKLKRFKDRMRRRFVRLKILERPRSRSRP